MLRISKLADYGTVVMVDLARHTEGYHNAKDIAARNHLKAPTVSKLLKLLAAEQLVISHRGAKGGYSLARLADTMSVAEIVSAVEGNDGLTECSQHSGDCALEAVCTIRDNWQVISRAVTDALKNVTLAQLAKPNLQQYEVNVSDVRLIGETG